MSDFWDRIGDAARWPNPFDSGGALSRGGASEDNTDETAVAPKPKAKATSPTAPKPDAVSQVGSFAKSDPGFAQYLAQHPIATPASTSPISYWSGVGVDPDAPVLGVDRQWDTSGFNDTPWGQQGRTTKTQKAGEWLQSLYTMSAPELAQVQQDLWSQGWYEGTNVKNPAQIQFGRPDAATLQAYGLVLAETARYNLAGKQIAIPDVVALGSPLRGQAQGTGSPTAFTNPADLKDTLQTQAQHDIGRDLSPQDEAAFAQSYAAQEDAARREMISIGPNNGSYEGPPQQDTAAGDYIDMHHLADKVAYGAAVRQQAFFQMLGAPV